MSSRKWRQLCIEPYQLWKKTLFQTKKTKRFTQIPTPSADNDQDLLSWRRWKVSEEWNFDKSLLAFCYIIYLSRLIRWQWQLYRFSIRDSSTVFPAVSDVSRVSACDWISLPHFFLKICLLRPCWRCLSAKASNAFHFWASRTSNIICAIPHLIISTLWVNFPNWMMKWDSELN